MSAWKQSFAGTIAIVALAACTASVPPDVSSLADNGSTATAALLGTGTASGTSAAIPAAIGSLADTSPTGILATLQSDFVENDGYRSWKTDGVHWIAALSSYGASYLSPDLAQALAAGSPTDPVGAVAVLELYADAAGSTLNAWGILAKGTSATTPSAWLSYLIKSTGGVFAQPATNDMGDQACAQCHTPAPGYIIPLSGT